jgi:hypothetical protein
MTAWRMSFRAGTNGPEMWDKYCRPLKVAAIEYGPVDDVDFTPYKSEEEFPPHVRKAWAKLKPNEKTNLKRFLFEMKEGHTIYVKKGAMIVGKGVVGPYHFDKKGRIQDPNDGSFWRHQRPTAWVQGLPEVRLQLGNQQIRTVKRLDDADVAIVEAAFLGHQLVSLPAKGAEQDEPADGTPYVPENVDRREVVERQIRQRRGQEKFRDALRKRYGDRCVVTGCTVLDVLEAAHIKPYQGEGDNHPANGLLLRADIHTLFDLDLLGIEPDGLQIRLHPLLATEYAKLDGKKLTCQPKARPSKDALALRYKLFQHRLHQDEQ